MSFFFFFNQNSSSRILSLLHESEAGQSWKADPGWWPLSADSTITQVQCSSLSNLVCQVVMCMLAFNLLFSAVVPSQSWTVPYLCKWCHPFTKGRTRMACLERSAEWLTLEGTSRGCLVQAFCSSRAIYRRQPSNMSRCQNLSLLLLLSSSNRKDLMISLGFERKK